MSASKTGEAEAELTRKDEKFDDGVTRETASRAELAKQPRTALVPPNGDIGPLYHSRHNYPTA